MSQRLLSMIVGFQSFLIAKFSNKWALLTCLLYKGAPLIFQNLSFYQILPVHDFNDFFYGSLCLAFCFTLPPYFLSTIFLCCTPATCKCKCLWVDSEESDSVRKKNSSKIMLNLQALFQCLIS